MEGVSIQGDAKIKALKVSRGVWCGEGVSTSHWRRGLWRGMPLLKFKKMLKRLILVKFEWFN